VEGDTNTTAVILVRTLPYQHLQHNRLHWLILLLLPIICSINRLCVEPLTVIYWLCEVDCAGVIGVHKPEAAINAVMSTVMKGAR
jgi:hypothetical protein